MFYNNKISAVFSIIFPPYLSYHRTYLRANQDIICTSNNLTKAKKVPIKSRHKNQDFKSIHDL